jgi:deoxyribodipyrimidine photo-lyase
MTKTNILWFKKDLRLSDNIALVEASKNARVMLIYILESDVHGSASAWWRTKSLQKLNESLDNQLNFYIGDPKEIIPNLVKKLNVDSVYWNADYEPEAIKTESIIRDTLSKIHVQCKRYNSSLLWAPSEILKSDSTPYKIFTHFYRNGCLKHSKPRLPISAPKYLSAFKDPESYSYLEYLGKMPKNQWHEKINNHWVVGEKEAERKLQHFLNQGLSGYKELRNHPDKNNVSRLSPHLHFGEISPNQIWHAVQVLDNFNSADADHFLSELGWREFSYYLLYHFPEITHTNLQPKFNAFPWQDSSALLNAWKNGQTGYPIVDAGMRELWGTGYMHNRVRMIVGSFLVKNLLIHWHHGAEWFWDCLVDADLANNSASWQWVAGSGADAAPYFRIFNPILQGEKFDSQGLYTKKFVPELKNIPEQFLFKPWLAPKDILKKAGIELGTNYPTPIIDLASSRNKALGAYDSLSCHLN